MNKFLKGCLVSACVCIILGIVILAGVAVSGRGYEVIDAVENGGIGWNENGFVVGSTVVLENKAASDFSVINGKEYTYPADEIENLSMELEAGVFRIIEGDTNEIIIQSDKTVEISNDGDDLSIETPNRFELFGFGNMDGQNIEITLPKGHEFHTIELEVGAGELAVESLFAEDITLELGAGRIEVDNYTCKSASVSVGAGEVIVGNGSTVTMDLDVGMGDFQFKGTVTDDLDADCGMGNMDIVLSGQDTDHNYQIDCGMGDVSIGDTSYGGMASSQVIDNHASSDFDLDCGMGNISIAFSR